MSKKIIAVILAIIMLMSVSSVAFAEGYDSFGAYDHVFIIGVDGAGQFFKDADTPNFDAIFKNQAVTYDATAEYITVSAENWGSILCGVDYETHGFTNDYIKNNQRDSSAPNPSLFRLIRQQDKAATLASFSNWKPINNGIVENDLGVDLFHASSDPLVANAVCNYLDAGNAPKLMFVQLDSVDSAGHSTNCHADRFLNAINTADRQIGDIYNAAYRNGLLKNGLFIVVSDHGHSPEGGHGGRTPEEYLVTVAVAGKTVATSPELSEVKNRDVASIALYALGIEQPDSFTSVVPNGLFGENNNEINEPLEKNSFVRFFRAIGAFVLRVINFFVILFSGNLNLL